MKRMPLNVLMALLLSGIFSATYGQKAPGQVETKKNTDGISSADASAERDRLELERQKFAFEKEIERQKIADEQRKTWLTAASTFIPLLLGVLTIYYAVRNQAEQAKSSFELKAAEIIMDHPHPGLIKYRAKVLVNLFPSRLPEDFGKSFDPEKYYGPSYHSKIELFRLIGQKPELEREIVRVWRRLFPADK